MGILEKTLSNPVTVQELKALTAEQQGKRFAVGQSTYCTVHQATDKSITVRFEWRFKSAGKIRTMHLGTWPNQSLKALNDRRAELQQLVKQGVDPIAKAQQDRELAKVEHEVLVAKAEAERLKALAEQEQRLRELEAQNARITVRSLFAIWEATDLKKRADAGAEARRAFERDVFPAIGNKAAADVTKADIQAIIDAMMARGVTRMTKRVFSDLRQLLGFAVDRDHIETDPTARIKKAKIGKDVERDRVLKEPELIRLFQLLPASGLVPSSQRALLIQLSTISRIGEILGARWEHVDLERREWILPETKNGRRHVVYLSDFALQQFKAQREQTGLTPWVYPAAQWQGDKPELNRAVCPKSITKQVADRQRGGDETNRMSGRTKQIDSLILPGGQWRPHDLRRTGATLMAELGALPDVIERCLNHVEPNKIKRIYQHAKFEGPMRDAWNLLGQRLALLQDQAAGRSTNVVTFNKAA